MSPDRLGDTSVPCSFEDRPGVVASAWRSGENGLEARTERRIEVLGAAQPSPVCLLLCCRGHRFAQEGRESRGDSVSCPPPLSIAVRGPALCALTPYPGSEALGAQG